MRHLNDVVDSWWWAWCVLQSAKCERLWKCVNVNHASLPPPRNHKWDHITGSQTQRSCQWKGSCTRRHLSQGPFKLDVHSLQVDKIGRRQLPSTALPALAGAFKSSFHFGSRQTTIKKERWERILTCCANGKMRTLLIFCKVSFDLTFVCYWNRSVVFGKGSWNLESGTVTLQWDHSNQSRWVLMST